jgi:hypothetical protein
MLSPWFGSALQIVFEDWPPHFYLFVFLKFDIDLVVKGTRKDRWVRNRLCCSGAEAPSWQRWAWPQIYFIYFLCTIYFLFPRVPQALILAMVGPHNTAPFLV